MYLINAHGPDHGLSVEVVYGDVIVRQWGERDEPDEHGSHMPHIQTARIALENLLDKNLPHYACGNVSRGSMHEKIIDLALNWLGYSGGHECFVDDTDRPCDHFEMNYSGIGLPYTEPWPDHMTCSECGQVPV